MTITDKNNFWQPQIDRLYDRICSEFKCDVMLCGEIEAYVDGVDAITSKHPVWQSISDTCAEQSLPLESIGKESDDQYEFRLKPVQANKSADHIEKLKKVVDTQARIHGIDIVFDAYHDGRPSNGLHLHLHLLNDEGQHIFMKSEDEMTPPLKQTLGGLCTTMNDLMLCFVQSDAAYKRLNSGEDHVPQVISWGGNNRTVALRMPESVVPFRHIEHRVSAADTNPYAAIWAVLVGIHYGLIHDTDPGEQIYGNATDDVYKRTKLHRHPSDVKQAFEKSKIAGDYCDVDDVIAQLT